jgi:hypothetical protein
VRSVTGSSKWHNVFVCLQYDTGNGQKIFVSELGQRLGSNPNLLKLSGALEAVYKIPDKNSIQEHCYVVTVCREYLGAILCNSQLILNIHEDA